LQQEEKHLLLVVDDGLLDIGLDLLKDRSTETSDGIPALGSGEALASRGAAVLSALIVTNGDVSEGSRLSSSHLVEERIQETERTTGLGVHIAIEHAHEASEDGARAGSTTNRLDSSRLDEDLRAKSGNIGISAALSVEHLGRGERDA
jgi:hypothetical protein